MCREWERGRMGERGRLEGVRTGGAASPPSPGGMLGQVFDQAGRHHDRISAALHVVHI